MDPAAAFLRGETRRRRLRQCASVALSGGQKTKRLWSLGGLCAQKQCPGRFHLAAATSTVVDDGAGDRRRRCVRDTLVEQRGTQ